MKLRSNPSIEQTSSGLRHAILVRTICMFFSMRARGEAEFLTGRALKLAPDNDEVKKVA